jgi:hypothetical protein
MTHLTATMRCVVLIVIALGALMAPVQDACAQTEKTMLHDDMHGQPVRSPYITPSEFENIRIGEKTQLGTLLLVESVDEATRLLGPPKSRDVLEFEGGRSYLARISLLYDDFTVTYMKTTSGTFLYELKTTTSRWPVQIGDTKVSPGMDAGGLSEPVRDAAQPSEDNPAHSLTYVKLYDAQATTRGEKEMNEHTTIEVKINDLSGEVVWFRIHRVI